MKLDHRSVRAFRAFVACLVLATSGFVPGLPNMVRSIAETVIDSFRPEYELADHDDDCAAKDSNGECDGCPLACHRCACVMPRALVAEPKIALSAPRPAIDPIPTPYRSLSSESPVASIFHPPRA